VAKRDLIFIRSDGLAPSPRSHAWIGGALAWLYLAGVVIADFVLPVRYVLIEYYGVAALIAAATLGWRMTAATGGLAVAAGLFAGQVDDGDLVSSAVLLPVGSVAASALVAMVVAAIRERREGRLAAMTEVAEVAEHAIVRTAPISLPDLEVAAVYRSASNLASVGGDLYEAVSTPYGSRLIIGDARGKGLPAVQMAAVVLGAFRHAALSEPDLGRLVTDLDRTVAAFASDEDFVTALIIEVGELEVRMSCCGHPWPLIGPPGYVRPIEVEPSLPLGLGGPRTVQVRGFPTRQILIAYTDGLIEARDERGEMLQIGAVAAAIHTWEPEEAIMVMERAFIDHVAGAIQDDVTILAMKRIAR
jgi:sigma-B regulation protein RsbU (phosphoserine phosphatase)